MSVDQVDQEVFADGPLRVSWHRYGQEVLVVSLSGELDQSNVGSLRRAVFDLTADGTEELLVVDLSALEFIDSAGIALLFGLAEGEDDGKGLRIVPSRAPGVERVLKLTGLGSHARIAEDLPARAA